MALTDTSVNASVPQVNNRETPLQKRQVKQCISLVVLCFVPFSGGILYFTDSIKVAVDLLGAMFEKQPFGLVSVISKRRYLGTILLLRVLPYYFTDEAAQISDREAKLNGVALAHRQDRL